MFVKYQLNSLNGYFVVDVPSSAHISPQNQITEDVLIMFARAVSRHDPTYSYTRSILRSHLLGVERTPEEVHERLQHLVQSGRAEHLLTLPVMQKLFEGRTHSTEFMKEFL